MIGTPTHTGRMWSTTISFSSSTNDGRLRCKDQKYSRSLYSVYTWILLTRPLCWISHWTRVFRHKSQKSVGRSTDRCYPICSADSGTMVTTGVDCWHKLHGAVADEDSRLHHGLMARELWLQRYRRIPWAISSSRIQDQKVKKGKGSTFV